MTNLHDSVAELINCPVIKKILQGSYENFSGAPK